MRFSEGEEERAVDDLIRAGFPQGDISVLLPENLGAKEIGTEKATKAPKGAAAGVTTGGVIGGTLGILLLSNRSQLVSKISCTPIIESRDDVAWGMLWRREPDMAVSTCYL